jgi:hypothetical protein
MSEAEKIDLVRGVVRPLWVWAWAMVAYCVWEVFATCVDWRRKSRIAARMGSEWPSRERLVQPSCLAPGGAWDKCKSDCRDRAAGGAPQ